MDLETVKKTAFLARLAIDDKKAEALTGELSAIFNWIEQLNEVDTEGVEPMTSAVPHEGHWREDVVRDGNKQGDILANAPESAEGFFVVPKVIE